LPLSPTLQVTLVQFSRPVPEQLKIQHWNIIRRVTDPRIPWGSEPDVPEFEKRWNHYARPVGDSWRVDETYIKVKGQWVYLYRAVDKQGRTVDFLLSKRRDVAAAKRFFSRAAKQHGAPRVITLDGYAASHRAVDKLKNSGILPRRVQVRSCAYLNNVIEQDHRRIKQRVRPMLGFKRFDTASVTIRGIELAEKIKKQQFNLKPLTRKATTAPEMWARVLAA
jgi:transposase-like protein